MIVAFEGAPFLTTVLKSYPRLRNSLVLIVAEPHATSASPPGTKSVLLPTVMPDASAAIDAESLRSPPGQFASLR